MIDFDRERRGKISLTQAALQRVERDGIKRFIREFSPLRILHDLKYVENHFSEDDVRKGLGVTNANNFEVLSRLHGLTKALDSRLRKRSIFG